MYGKLLYPPIFTYNFINLLSASLKADFPDAKGFSPRNLARMRKFYETHHDLSNLPPAAAKLPWSFDR
ncbi:MAG: DUF1016 domain-containing protein [Erysipelotrichaceae bacterium]|nr:DUF1016 domain-containing protein [Erysipelotrichaceae bacterium]